LHGASRKRTKGIEEHKGSAIGRHIKEQHGQEPDNIEKNFLDFKEVPEQA